MNSTPEDRFDEWWNEEHNSTDVPYESDPDVNETVEDDYSDGNWE